MLTRTLNTALNGVLQEEEASLNALIDANTPTKSAGTNFVAIVCSVIAALVGYVNKVKRTI